MARQKTATTLETSPEGVQPSVLSEFHMLPSDSITTGQNIRSDFDESGLNGLAESIRVNGIIEPLVVCRQESDPLTYLLVAGERRYRAALIVGIDELPCQVYPALSQSQILEIMFSENLHRQDLNPIEEADGIRRMLDAGMTQESLGDRLGKSQEWVSNRLRLLDAPESLRTEVISQEITPSHILKLFSYRSKLPENLYMDFIDYYAAHHTNRDGTTIPVSGFDQILKDFISKSKDESIVLYARFSIGDAIYNDRCISCPNNILDGYACLDGDCLRDLRCSYKAPSTAPDEGDRPILMSNGITYVSGRFCAGCARKISEDGKDYCPDRRCFEARSQDMRERIESYRRCIDDALRDSIVEVCSEDPRGMFVRFSNDLLQESFPFADQLGIIIDETDSETVILEKVCILHFMSSIGLGRYTPELVLDQYRNFCKDHGIKPKSLMSWSDCLKEIASEMSEDIPPVLSDSGEVGTSDEEVHA